MAILLKDDYIHTYMLDEHVRLSTSNPKTLTTNKQHQHPHPHPISDIRSYHPPSIQPNKGFGYIDKAVWTIIQDSITPTTTDRLCCIVRSWTTPIRPPRFSCKAGLTFALSSAYMQPIFYPTKSSNLHPRNLAEENHNTFKVLMIMMMTMYDEPPWSVGVCMCKLLCAPYIHTYIHTQLLY